MRGYSLALTQHDVIVIVSIQLASLRPIGPDFARQCSSYFSRMRQKCPGGSFVLRHFRLIFVRRIGILGPLDQQLSRAEDVDERAVQLLLELELLAMSRS